MTTDKVTIEEDTGANAQEADRKLIPSPDTEALGGGDRQPPQPQQRGEPQIATPITPTGEDADFASGNKGKSPGNGG